MGKKKGKVTGKKGKKIVDGLSTAEMSREQLLGHIKRLQNEIDREREERNFFMLERQKLFSLWSLALEKINLEKDKARCCEVHLDDVRESKEEESKMQKQKVRFLMCEQLKNLGKTRLDYLYRVRDHQREFSKVVTTLRHKVAEEKRQVSAARLSHLQAVRDLQVQNVENVSSIRKKYLAEVRRLEVDSDRRLIKHQNCVELETSQTLIQLQVIKDEQIHKLVQLHEEQLNELKNYYNEITVNNLGIITTLQEELQESSGNRSKLAEELQLYRIQNQKLELKVQELGQKMVEWTEDEKKMASRIKQVQRSDKAAEHLKNNLSRLKIANEALVQKTLETEEEKKFLKEALAKTIMENQIKSTMNQILYRDESPSVVLDELDWNSNSYRLTS